VSVIIRHVTVRIVESTSDIFGIVGTIFGALGAAASAYAVFRGRHRILVSLTGSSWALPSGEVKPFVRVLVTTVGRSVTVESIDLEWLGPGPPPPFGYGPLNVPGIDQAMMQQLWPGFSAMTPLTDGESRPFFFEIQMPDLSWTAGIGEAPFQMRAVVQLAHGKKPHPTNSVTLTAPVHRAPPAQTSTD